jgi:hypothetical protein
VRHRVLGNRAGRPWAGAVVLVLGSCVTVMACSGLPMVSVDADNSAQAPPTSVPPTKTASPPLPTATLSLVDAAELVKGYTTLVWTTNARGQIGGLGSGISLGEGKVVTNNHVVRGASAVWVRFADGRRDQVQVVRTDARRDLALLQSSFMDQPAARLGDSRTLRAAENVLAVGYPLADVIGARDATVTRGIFSGMNEMDGVWHVQTDTPVNPGNSGGPLTDSQARVIGVVRRGVRNAVGLNFAIASDETQAFLQRTDVPADTQAPAPPTSTLARSASGATPSNVWTVILHGDLGSESEAQTRANAAATNFTDVGVLNSSRYSNLRPGFWVVYAGKYTDESAARTAASTAQTAGYAGAYPRWLTEPGARASDVPTATPLPISKHPGVVAVERFYTSINARDLRTAWDLLGPSFRSRNEYDGWAKGFDTTRSVQIRSVDLKSQADNEATVEFTIAATDAIASGVTIKVFQGTWLVKQINGAWKLDVPSIRQIQ